MGLLSCRHPMPLASGTDVEPLAQRLEQDSTTYHVANQGAPQPLQKELGPLGTGTRRFVGHKFDALGVHCRFLLSFACNASSSQGENLCSADW